MLNTVRSSSNLESLTAPSNLIQPTTFSARFGRGARNNRLAVHSENNFYDQDNLFEQVPLAFSSYAFLNIY